MGHVTHPSLLLFQLGFERAAALQQQGHPALLAGQGIGLEGIAVDDPFHPLGPLLGLGQPGDRLQFCHRHRFGEQAAAGELGWGQLQQLFCPGVDVINAQLGIEAEPAHRGRLDPGLQLGGLHPLPAGQAAAARFGPGPAVGLPAQDVAEGQAD